MKTVRAVLAVLVVAAAAGVVAGGRTIALTVWNYDAQFWRLERPSR